MITNKLLLLILSGVILLSSCNLPVGQASGFYGPQAWIDTPLDQSALPLAPVLIVAHGYDPSGVALFELSVNGAVANTAAPTVANGNLYQISESWNPPASGNYTLTIRAQGTAGAWGAPASVSITVGLTLPTPIETSTLPITPSPEPTITAGLPASATPTAPQVAAMRPTAPPLPTNTPKPTSDAVTFSHSVTNKVLKVGGCGGPTSTTINVKITNPGRVQTVMFYPVFHAQNGNVSVVDPTALDANGTGKFKKDIAIIDSPRTENLTLGSYSYHFVALDGNGKEVGRSNDFSDLSITHCKATKTPTQSS